MPERRERARLRRLIEQSTRLHFRVLTVGIGEQVLPDHPLPRQAPDPDLLSRFLVTRRIAHHAEILVVPVRTKEVGRLAEHVIRLVAAEIVVVVIAEITAGTVDRPRTVLTVVSEETCTGIDELQIALYGNGGVHPRVVRLLE